MTKKSTYTQPKQKVHMKEEMATTLISSSLIILSYEGGSSPCKGKLSPRYGYWWLSLKENILTTSMSKRRKGDTIELEALSQWYICSLRNHVNCRLAKFLQQESIILIKPNKILEILSGQEFSCILIMSLKLKHQNSFW